MVKCTIHLTGKLLLFFEFYLSNTHDPDANAV